MARRHRSGQNNLPAPGTGLVGRDEDIAHLRQLVLQAQGRLVTLTGVAGCGKTQLALRVAADLAGSFKDGIWLVELAPSPPLVAQAVAAVLGVPERPDKSRLQGLVAHLARRHLLLVLDNCEHLVQVCAELVGAVLQGAPNRRVLTTSREPQHIGGEATWRVRPLAFPDSRVCLAAELPLLNSDRG